MTDQLLIIFVKNPILGKVKTRLAATVGADRALKIYRNLLEYTRVITKDLLVDKVVFYSEFIDEKDQWDQASYQKQLQSSGDLGNKMKTAFEWGFRSGYHEICIIGSDCFELTPETIMSGFHILAIHHAALGPTHDGGYYLLGLKQMQEPVFKNKNWGTDSVAEETLADLQTIGLSTGILTKLHDIDMEQDLEGYEL